jgi:hypothetical protein
MQHPFRAPLSAWMILTAALFPLSARGQTTDPAVTARAQKLFDQAAAEMDAGNYAAACKRLEEVTLMLPAAIGGKENLGECYEKQGKLASAWAQYTAAEGLATRAGQRARAQAAARSAAALKPRLATLTIDVPGDLRQLPEITLTKNGAPVEPAQWGPAQAVDPGSYEVAAGAPGRQPFRKKVEIAKEGAKETLTIALPPVDTASGSATTPVDPAPAPARSWQLPAGLVAGGAGLLGIGVGAVLGGLAIGRNDASKADGHCNASNGCDDTGFALRTESLALGNAATAAMVAGGVLVAGGVVLVVLAPRGAKPPAPKELSKRQEGPPGDDVYRAPLQIRLHATGLSLKGAW